MQFPKWTQRQRDKAAIHRDWGRDNQTISHLAWGVGDKFWASTNNEAKTGIKSAQTAGIDRKRGDEADV